MEKKQMASQKQFDACLAVANKVAEEYVESYTPELFKGTAEKYLKEHPDMIRYLVQEIVKEYEANA